MANFTPMIGIYIPSITYTSVGPGFVDAIKLEARNLYLPVIKYKVYTQYTSDGTLTDGQYIYRLVVGSRIDTPSSYNPVTSVLYSDDDKRCQHGRFYDYIDSDPNDTDGGLNHTLTCFSKKSKIQELESFTINARDGIYVVETDEADAAIELIFTFYTLSYDKYDSTVPEKPVDPVTYFNCPDDYIEIGTMTKIVRASTLGQNEEATMAVEDELEMYYDINTSNEILYLPVGGDFKAVVGLESDDPKVVKSGNTIFDKYEEEDVSLNADTDWGDPIVVGVDNFSSESDSETLEKACLAAYMPKKTPYTANEATTNNQKEYFSPPTFVDINLYKHTSQLFTTKLDIHSLDVSNSSMLWSTIPTYAVLNMTYNTRLHDQAKTYSPCTILEYLPELGKINYKVTDINSDFTTIDTIADGEQALQHFTRTGTSCIVGRFFSFALSKLPNTKFNILQYCNNFQFSRPLEGENAAAFFVKRPAYIKDSVDSEIGLYKQDDYSLFTGDDHFKGTLKISGYAIDSTSLHNYLLNKDGSEDTVDNIYPLKKYFTEKDPKDNWQHSYNPSLTLGFKRVQADGGIVQDGGTTDSRVATCFDVNKSAYCHIFTTDDLENLPSILGKDKIYTSDAFISISDICSETKIPIISMNKRWGFSDVFTDTGNMVIDWRTEKSPSHRFYPNNDYLRMINWADEFAGDGNYKVGDDPETKLVDDYKQVLVLSPMLAIDMDESNTTLSNKGDYKVIPAYYYGNADDSDAVITDYKNLSINIKDIGDTFDLNVKSDAVMPFVPTSTFIDYKELPTVYPLYSSATVTVQIDLDSSFKPGLYVLKFLKYFTSGDRPELKSQKLKCTYDSKNYTVNYDFIVIMVNKNPPGNQIKLTFYVASNVSAYIANFKLYQVDMSNNKNLNQVLLSYWYNEAKGTALGKPEVSVVWDNDKDAFHKLVYDNIIFPSAICAYESFTLFADVDGGLKPYFTRLYKAAYLPKNPIYNIIGLYNIQNTAITLVDDLPDDVFVEELICYNQPSRYV